MFCPVCFSDHIRGPEYRAIPGGFRHSALMSCQVCGKRFDAYRSYGNTPSSMTRWELAA